jgi:RNA polymerase sigma factor (sigma-70 family)
MSRLSVNGKALIFLTTKAVGPEFDLEPMSEPHSTASSVPDCPEASGARVRWFEDEVHARDSQLRSYVRRTFPSIRDVDDVVQESYLRAWRRHLVLPIASAGSFLFAVARHVAIDTLRRRRRSPIEATADPAAVDATDPSAGASDAVCSMEELDLLADAISSLPPRCRQIVILRKLHGLSQKEIAAQMGISERTVEVQGSKGLDRCEAYLRKCGVVRGKV